MWLADCQYNNSNQTYVFFMEMYHFQNASHAYITSVHKHCLFFPFYNKYSMFKMSFQTSQGSWHEGPEIIWHLRGIRKKKKKGFATFWTSLVTYCIQQNEKHELRRSAPVAHPVVRRTSNKSTITSPFTVCSQKLCMCPTFTMLLLVRDGEVSVRKVAVQHTESRLKLQIINIKNKICIRMMVIISSTSSSKINVALQISFLKVIQSMCQESQGEEKAKESRYKQNWFIQQDENVMH